MRVLIFGLMAVMVGCVEPIDRPENITPTSQPIVASFTQVPVQVGVTFTPRPQPSPTTEPTATATSTATATPTPEPSPTPEQAPTAVPTETPEPTPTDTPVPTQTPTPTATSTATATPTHTPVPGPELFVDVLGPADGATVQSDAIVVYGFTSPVATLSINGKQASVGQNGRFQEEVTLEPGENRIDIIATDNRGNEEIKSITVTLLQPQPFVLVITEPEDQSIVFTDNVRLAGFTSPDAVVSVNGISISVEAFGGIGVFETAMTLEPGPNIIDIVATNSTGKVLSTVIAIIYRPN